MEFLTLHELSRELNKPERQLRHKFKNLLKQNTLTEGEDFIREGYVDDQHFVFKINPVRFVALTQLNPAPLPDQSGYHVATNFDNTDNNRVTTVDNKPPEPVTNLGNQQTHTATSDPEQSTDTSMTNEFIELMKEQLREKDKQLHEKDNQLKSKDELLKLVQEQAKDKDNAQILALSEIIRLNKKLLPPPPSETVIDMDTSGYHDGSPVDTTGGNHTANGDNNFGTN